MRTRILNKMTAKEVEDYLARGGDTIFVGVGVVEVHGPLPVDCETIVPEAYAVLMAEKADGLALINLPYMFPGATIVSNATVQVTVRQSIDYLMMISRSLVAQGFRKIFYISGHGPSDLYINAMCRDFFHETKIHVCHLHIGGGIPTGPIDMSKLPKTYGIYGAYKIMGQMEYLPVDPNAEEYVMDKESPEHTELKYALQPFGARPNLYYATPDQHIGGMVFRSEQERLEACERGEREMREKVEKLDIERLKRAIDAYHAHVQRIIEKYPRLGGQY